jgi:valyl-tRNA synthetase
MIKPVYGEPIDRFTYEATLGFFEQLMKILHPFMPFISEELYHELRERQPGDCVIVAVWPKAKEYDAEIIRKANKAFSLVTALRNVRNEKQISPKDKLQLIGNAELQQDYESFLKVIEKIANLEAIHFDRPKPEKSISCVVDSDEFCIPVNELIDLEAEKEKLQKEIAYQQGFLTAVMKKLSNERFVNHAPAQVVEMEQKKKNDAESRIKVLEETLRSLN